MAEDPELDAELDAPYRPRETREELEPVSGDGEPNPPFDSSGQTMAELKTRADHDRSRALDSGQTPDFQRSRDVHPNRRDDELLTDPPLGDHHLGRFGGWEAGSRGRRIITGVLGAAVLAGIVAVVTFNSELRERRLHPMPEVEATITPGTPREMSFSEGKFRVGLSREAPAVNLVHLPDRDITLARGAEKAQFKVEIRDGQTRAIKVLTGEIVETLTAEGARPLLD